MPDMVGELKVMGYNPPISERPDPWIHKKLIPRGSTQIFKSVPWEPPASLQLKREKPAAWFEQYRKATRQSNARPVSAAPVLQGTDTRYQPCEVNPGVGYDTRRHNFTLLARENGALKPFGSFLTEDAGIQGQGGMKDKEERGPHGIVGLMSTNKKDGVPKKMLDQLNGPPGVQLQPPGHWQNNLGAVHQERVEYNPDARYTNLGFANQNRNANVGDWRTPQNRPASASLLTNRPAAARRQRPSTACRETKASGRRPNVSRGWNSRQGRSPP